MPSNTNGSEQPAGKHVAAVPQELSKREQRKADKAQRKAEKQAVKDAKKAAKAARKAAAKGGGVVAPVAATPEEALGHAPQEKTPSSAAQPHAEMEWNQEGVAPEALESPDGLEEAGSQEVPEGGQQEKPDAPAVQATTDAYEFEEQVNQEKPGSYDEEYGYIPAAVAAEQYSRYNANPELDEKAQENRKRKRRRNVIAAVLVVLLCLVGAGGAGAYMYMNSLNQNLAGEDEQEAEEVKEALTPVPLGDEPFYMLLVGCDDREGVEGARADTTILARLDPKNNVVTLISIPRDTAIEIPGYGTEKFNAAYALGGPSGTIEAASALCGVDISHYAEVHFEALIDIIDYIGGVDVDVPIPIDDVDAGGKLDAGMQHLNGAQAMVFARSRSYLNGDFQRTTSQRLLIEAAVDKVRALPATELPGLLMQVTQSLTTDLTVQELLGMVLAFQDEPDLTMYSAMVPSTTADMDGVSYVVTDVYLLQEMMEVIDAGGDPATVVPDDYTVSTSDEAKEQGIELIVNLGDDTPDEGASGYVDYGYTGYYYDYDPSYYYYGYSYDGAAYDDGGYDAVDYDDYDDYGEYEDYEDYGADEE